MVHYFMIICFVNQQQQTVEVPASTRDQQQQRKPQTSTGYIFNNRIESVSLLDGVAEECSR